MFQIAYSINIACSGTSWFGCSYIVSYDDIIDITSVSINCDGEWETKIFFGDQTTQHCDFLEQMEGV